MYRTLRQAARQAGPEIVALAQRLVRLRSVSLFEKEVSGCVEDAMGDLGFDLVFRDDVGNVIGAFVGSRTGPTVLLNSHMDTVPPDERAWNGSPYAGTIEDGRLVGVGASDCKGGLAAQIYGAALLAHSALPVAGNIVVAATVAEENGCSVGVRHVIDESLPRIGLTADCAILGEPTSLGLYCGHDGWVDFDVRIAHPGGNASADAGRVAESFRRAIPQEAGGRVQMQTANPMAAPDDPAHACIVRVTRRVTPSLGVEGLEEWVRQRAKDAVGESRAELRVDVREEEQRLCTGQTARVRFESRPWETDRYEPLVDGAREALVAAGWSRVRVTDWRLRQLGMGTAGSRLVCDYRIPTIGFGPGDERWAHQPQEMIRIPRLIEAAYGTAVLAHRLVGAAAFEWPAFGSSRTH